MNKLTQKGIGAVPVLLAIFLIGAIGATGFIVYQNKNDQTAKIADTIDSFDECAAAGNPIMESYPEQCSANGKTFVNETQKVEIPEIDDSENKSEVSTLAEAINQTIKNEFGPESTCNQSSGVHQAKWVINNYYKDNAATVEISCGESRSTRLYVYQTSAWKDVYQTKSGFTCQIVDKYKVSKTVVSECFYDDPETGKIITRKVTNP